MIEKSKMLLGTSVAAGAVGIACLATIDHIYALPATIPLAFVCARWGACRRRRPMPEAWFTARKH